MIIRVCLATALLVMPITATAQGNPGPFGQLFGRAPASTGQEQTLVEVRSDLSGMYDTMLMAPEGERLDRTQSGAIAGASAGLIVDHTSERFDAGLRGGVAHEQHFRDPEPFGANRFSADAHVKARLSDRWETEAAAAYAHLPTYQYFGSFGQTSGIAIDTALLPFSPYSIESMENESIDGSAAISGNLTDHSTLSARVGSRQMRFPQQPASNYESRGYRAGWNYKFTRDLSLHAGYGQEKIDSHSDSGTGYDHEVIDLGVDYRKSFSLARRTELAFTTSTSIVKQTGFERQLRVNGSIVVTKNFRRTWRAGAEASRSTDFIPGFVEPVFSDFVGASLSGMFSKRVDWSSSVAAGKGREAFSGSQSFTTVTATSRLSMAVSRHIQLYAQYVVYRSDMPRGSTTLQLPPRVDRQFVAFGVSAYIPVYRKVRQGK